MTENKYNLIMFILSFILIMIISVIQKKSNNENI
jgi:hypothetical protein